MHRFVNYAQVRRRRERARGGSCRPAHAGSAAGAVEKRCYCWFGSV